MDAHSSVLHFKLSVKGLRPHFKKGRLFPIRLSAVNAPIFRVTAF